ncbi:MAG TPA: Xaa-Pro aminopeptidase [Candidatus Saccharimonadales bacterium]|jgi:Xaa-Pro aminopeptidase
MIDASYFTGNRQQLLSALPDDALVVMAGYGERQRRDDMAHYFEQEGNFWYLTGIESPDWWLILDGKTGKEWLVAPTVDHVKAAFDGSLDPQRATKYSGIRTVIDPTAATALLTEQKRVHRTVYTTEQPEHLRRRSGMQLDRAQGRMKRTLTDLFETVESCHSHLGRLRAIKQPAEIAAMRKAVTVTLAAFEDARHTLATVRHEYEVDATMTHHFRRLGARHGYDPIVAANANACTLHYVKNDDKLVDGSVVLIDVGARVGGFTADITRTYAKGVVSPRQRAVHQAVREAQLACIELLKPDVSLAQLQNEADAVLGRAIKRLGLPGEKLRDYMPHALGHGLGIDVHEGLAYDQLRPGMILTIEPGIYLPDEGIGVRIEDDILITADGYENLSAALSTSL